MQNIVRKCIVCGEKKFVQNLIKITKDFKTNEISVNQSNDVMGRSVYICKNEECVNKAFLKDKIFRSLKFNTEKEIKEKIKTVLQEKIVFK